MSQDFSNAKRGTGSVYPEKAFDASSALERVEPLLGPDEFKRRFFFGIPMVSPITKEKITAEDLKDYIKRAANQFELDTKTVLAPVIDRLRLPFDPNLYHQFIHLEIPHKPVQEVLRLAICSASYRETGTVNQNAPYPSGAQIYQIPNEWVEMGNATRGILNVNPINPAFSAVGVNTSVAASGATILQFIGQMGWVPAYWTVEYMYGFCSKNGNVPISVNECVGAKAAMMLIDNLLPMYAVVSQSLNMDGLGQSVANQTYQVLQLKRQQLEKDYIVNIGKIRNLTGNKILIGNV